MKEHDIDLQTLREGLAPLDKHCPLPEELRAQAVTQRMKAPRAPLFTLRRSLAFAAAAVVLFSTAFVSGRLGLFSGRPNLLPPGSTLADAEDNALPEDFESYYALEQAFLKMQAEAQASDSDARYIYSFWDVLGGFVGGAKSADSAAPGEAMENAVDFTMSAGAERNALYDGATEDAVTNTTATAGKGSHGSTNTQVQGVDEADILKNDGETLYYITGNTVYLLSARPADGMKVLSKLSIPSYRYDTQLYVQGDRMALVYSEYPPGGNPASSVQVYNIAKKTQPILVKTFSQEGTVLSSRMQNGRIYLISTQWANLGFSVKDGVIPPAEILPRVYNNGEEDLVTADCISILPEQSEPSYLVVSSLDLQSTKSESETAAILGAGSQMYCNTEALYVACQQYGNWRGTSEKTLIYRFDLLSNGKIKAGPQGEVAGSPLNQFSMDEYQGHFRIATTGWGKNDSVNILTILDKDLKEVGCLNNLAPGERIQSARFIGETGYIVTFRQTDPLFVINLSDPARPKVEGELKLPGFSAYLHPWDATHLIGIGPDGDEQGTNGGTKLSLFDISNPAAPKEIDRVQIPKSWTDIQQNHKIFTACKEQGLFGLPIAVHSNSGNYYSEARDFYTFRVQGDDISQSHVLEAAKAAQAKQSASSAEPYYRDYYEPSGAQRATYINGVWYVLGSGPASVTAYDMDSGKQLGELIL